MKYNTGEVMSGPTKKQLILEIFEREAMTSLGRAEVRRIQKKLVESLGPSGASSPGYIARVLAEAGKPVHIADAFSLPPMEEPYEQQFRDILKFGTLEQAEASLRRLSALYRKFKAAGDEKGMRYARSIALVGKRRAQAAARRARSAETRDVKREIVEWFTLWLYNPPVFDDWLELRKQSPEFQERWGNPPPPTRERVGRSHP